MPEDVVAARIREADVVEGPNLMSKAMSRLQRWYGSS